MMNAMERGSDGARGLPRGLGLAAVLATLLISPSPAPAQYPSWSFEIAEIVEIDPQAHIIRLIPAPSGLAYPRTCEEFVIHARFRDGTVWSLDGLFSSATYEKAIRTLRQSQTRKELVRVGSFERGFGAIDPELPCEVRSLGLAVLNDPDGIPAVYSIY